MPTPRIPWGVMRVALAALHRGETFESAAGLAGISKRTLFRFVADHGRMAVREGKPRAGSLTPVEREQIMIGIARGESDSMIADRLGRARSTIWREIGRNGGRGCYSAHQADENACENARRPQDPWTVTRPEVWAAVVAKLRLWWSPEQISAWLEQTYPSEPHWWVSHEAIYQAIYIQAKGELKAELIACLRQQRPQRRPHSRATKHKGSKISDMVPISKRPPEIEDRAIPGHWEGDLIVGKNSKSAIATIVERTTRFGFMVKLDSKHAPHVAERIAAKIATLGDFAFESLTWDQGTEMADHATFTLTTGAAVYFADPHSPWQRGTNENWNGLARQYFPKGTDLSIHTQHDLDQAAHSLNNRPRKTLNWATPTQQFNQLVATTP